MLNVSVIAYKEEDYELLKEQVTVEKVLALYAPIVKGATARYEFPNIGSLNFVFEGILDGGRTRNISFEESGKALSSLMLLLKLSVPDDYETRSEFVRKAFNR
jgi:hypothetical protein